MDNRAIGVFDSGFGGLTVLKELERLLPHEDVVYFGDNGRMPYGTKSKNTVIKYTLQDVKFLLSKDVKMIVIACNTASAVALDSVKEITDVPVIEVIGPGASAAVGRSISGRIGVIGTQATIQSGVYEKAILDIRKDTNVYKKHCPMFVPLVEEGWWDNEIAFMIAKEYLGEMREAQIDTLVLGCTHYPLLSDVIQRVIGEEIYLVSSAEAVANKVYDVLCAENLISAHDTNGRQLFYTSDDPEKFKLIGSSILNREITEASKIEIEKY